MAHKLISIFILIFIISIIAYFFSDKDTNEINFNEEKFIKLMNKNSYVRRISVKDISLQNCRLVWTYEPRENNCDSSHRLKFGAVIVDLDILNSQPTKLPSTTETQQAFWSSKNFKSTSFNHGKTTISSVNASEISKIASKKDKSIYSYETYCDNNSFITNEGSINLKLHKDRLDELLKLIKNQKNICKSN
jgi:hypothetical protein